MNPHGGAQAHGAAPSQDEQTTGHEWDGVKELNNPLPRWWLYVLYATIVWSFGYWIVYPSWPLATDYARGVWNYSSRRQALDEVAAAQAERDARGQPILTRSYAEIKSDPDLLKLALASGKAAFGDNCSGCHGGAATGRPGYPNLQDDEWLWGGQIEDIERTIRYGVRSEHRETRMSEMPAFGRGDMMKPNEIEEVANYVLSLSGKSFKAKADPAAGAALYAKNCASCHGDRAKGNREVGAPDLTDSVWLYGGDPAQIVATISNGRKGVMPSWEGKLSPVTIRSLAVYVHSLGGGK